MEKPDFRRYEAKLDWYDDAEGNYHIYQEKKGLARIVAIHEPKTFIICMCDGTSKSVRECLNAHLPEKNFSKGHENSIRICGEQGLKRIEDKFEATIHPTIP